MQQMKRTACGGALSAAIGLVLGCSLGHPEAGATALVLGAIYTTDIQNTISSSSVPISNSATYHFASPPAAISFTVGASAGPLPVASATLTSEVIYSGYGGIEGFAGAETKYYFEVLGPPDVVVPVPFTSGGYVVGEASNGDRLSGTAVVLVTGAGFPEAYEACTYMDSASTGYSSRPCDSVPGVASSTTLEVVSDSIYAVDLTAGVGQDFSNPGGDASISASADPYFFIDPTFPLASEFTLVLSAGVGNSPLAGILEPTSLALLIAGMAGIAAVRTSALRRVG